MLLGITTSVAVDFVATLVGAVASAAAAHYVARLLKRREDTRQGEKAVAESPLGTCVGS